MFSRLWSSTVARIVAAIFLLQILSGAATMLLLHDQMLKVIGEDRTRQVLDVRDDLLAAFYDGGRDGLVRTVTERRGSVADPLIFVALSGEGPPVLAHLAREPAIPVSGQPLPVRVVQAAGADPAEGLALATDLPDGSRLVVGAITTPDRQFDLAFAEAITLTVVLTGLLALVGALLIGYLISPRTHAIAQTAEALGSGDFGARIGNAEHGDGFDHLRRQMNFMAERIDRLVGELQSVSGALAHDLRSPVARLKAAIETAQGTVPDGPGADALALARTDAEVLEAMLLAALELIRLESGTVGDRRQPLDLAAIALDLAAIALDLAELYEPLAEQSGVTLACHTEPVTVLADRELLSRALANLIDNALKYGGSAIAVSVGIDQGMAVLEVADNGSGIPPEDRERAVGRFTRLDNARTRPGAGLGLALVAAVAGLHGGALELAASQPLGDESTSSGSGNGSGLVARLRLPIG